MPKIIISAGHTVMDPGDIFGDLKEADLTRKISSKLIDKLKEKNKEVVQVPLDLPLLQRIDWINNTGGKEENGDVCLEIHINSGGDRGIEAWHSGQSNATNSYDFANHLVNYIEKKTEYKNQGAKSEFTHELGSLTFLNRTNTISAIIECFYIDNDADIQILKDDNKLDDFVKVLADGIIDYQNNFPQSKLRQSSNNKPRSFTGYKPPAVGSSNSFIPNPPSWGGSGNTNQNNPPPLGSGFGGSPSITPPPPTTGGFNSPSTNTSSNLMQDRETRKEMIKNRYTQILGREPSQADLNYFLNIGISEDQLIKRMVESQEHVDIVKAKQELSKLQEEQSKIKNELINAKSKSKESEEMLKNLQELLDEKNRMITKMDQALINAGIKQPGTSNFN